MIALACGLLGLAMLCTAQLPISTATDTVVCPPAGSHLVLVVRGTLEKQGTCQPCDAALSAYSQTGAVYYRHDVIYPASFDQMSTPATQAVVNWTSTCRDSKIVTCGYSQGAAASTRAMSIIRNANAGAINFGNPGRRPNLLSSVDQYGRKDNRTTQGFEGDVGIPADWDRTDRVLDICGTSDPYCSLGPLSFPTSLVDLPGHLKYNEAPTPALVSGWLTRFFAQPLQRTVVSVVPER
ncbi:carbohydrate esterase family 5 protein [Mixia osmundae IAM 14324]|uniref:Cutinase n=1 Tax=Mixia osmundae (strain CBS 9802 / IAM 14324 / JCM 22182 / KY 12970) TaxID=764103 RepID=G7DXV4_MIXOS|nr:carbohydrate esterase family 5 protein [Mixia osmundae IAM 14324]KEI41317.1 carbohydrate esterase family 5 protein [Mixia osmundae IAM 14324]GAA95414.1 hypothetical protein E5Q_02068 [Mixia osmundae IAM 14324]